MEYKSFRDPEVVILESDPFDRVYKDLPARHLVLRKAPICEYCGAIRFPSEGPGFCCRQGKVNLVNNQFPTICSACLQARRIGMRCISKIIYATSTHISLALALELPWIIGSLLQLVTISC